MGYHPQGQLRVDGHPSGAVVVRLVGEHDVATADELDRTLSLLLTQGQPVIVDASRASFLDSIVLGILLSHNRKAEANAVPWRLVLPPLGAVRRVFEVAGSIAFLDTAASVEEAVEAFAAGDSPPPDASA